MWKNAGTFLRKQGEECLSCTIVSTGVILHRNESQGAVLPHEGLSRGGLGLFQGFHQSGENLRELFAVSEKRGFHPPPGKLNPKHSSVQPPPLGAFIHAGFPPIREIRQFGEKSENFFQSRKSGENGVFSLNQ